MVRRYNTPNRKPYDLNTGYNGDGSLSNRIGKLLESTVSIFFRKEATLNGKETGYLYVPRSIDRGKV